VKGIPQKNWFGWLSLVMVAGYFVVGWWPFAFRPPNRVTWLADRPGLHFEPSGIAYDAASLPALSSLSNAAGPSANFTLELWVEPQIEPNTDVFDLLSIHNPSLPFDFVLCQWKKELLLRATVLSPPPPRRIPEVSGGDVLPKQTARFITVRGDAAGTGFYLDGLAAAHFPGFMVNAEALDGRLILGNEASGKHSWTGQLFGLAVYDRALDAAEIARHCTLWTQGHAGQLTNAPGLRALYLFDEGRGQQAEDSSGNRHEVTIPAVYQVVQKEFLIPPWKDLVDDHPDYPDIVANILGFVPFGFCYFLYRRALKPNQSAANALRAVLAGSAVSLTIEIIQAWLPDRVSSMTDLLTNIAGTVLGVALAMAIQPKVAKAESASEAR
jgi:VanZ family protein